MGIGHWGRNLIRVFQEEAEVARCAGRGTKSSREWLAQVYPDLLVDIGVESLLEDATVEAVVVATPIATHAALAKRALEAGKHVFVEKPMADSSDAAAQLAALARERGLGLFVGHVMLHQPLFETLQRLVADDPAAVLNFSWQRYGPFREDPAWEFLPHPLAMAISLFGRPPAHVQALERALGPEARRLRVTLDFEPGACEVLIDTGFPVKCIQGFLQTGSGALLAWENSQLYELQDGMFRQVATSPEEPLRREVTAFTRLIRTAPGQRSYASADLGVEVVRAIEVIRPRASHVSGTGV